MGIWWVAVGVIVDFRFEGGDVGSNRWVSVVLVVSEFYRIVMFILGF